MRLKLLYIFFISLAVSPFLYAETVYWEGRNDEKGFAVDIPPEWDKDYEIGTNGVVFQARNKNALIEVRSFYMGETKTMDRVDDRRDPLAVRSQATEDARFGRVSVDNIRTERAHDSSQVTQGPEVRKGSHRTHQRRDRKKLQSVDRSRFRIEALTRAPRQANFECLSIEVLCGM